MKEKTEKIIAMIEKNENFANEFKSDPVKAVKSILGADLPDDLINNVISGVKAKIGTDKAQGVMENIKKLF
ncbi:MAG: hypothetical protein ACERLG_05540 [Sedimentibacter sp.]